MRHYYDIEMHLNWFATEFWKYKRLSVPKYFFMGVAKENRFGKFVSTDLSDFLNIFINLFPCRNLVKLDLSYNVIYDLSGLKKIHGSSFSLRSLYLHGNELSSLDHLINCLAGFRMLQELTLSLYGEANPVCEIPDYRSSVLASLKNLEVLDGQDRTGKPAATRDSVLDIPGWILGFC